MPLYQYQCQKCGLLFEGRGRVKTAAEGVPCQGCGAQAERKLTATGFGFSNQVKGLAPTNTGVSGVDHNFDRIIAEDANAKWRVITQRQNRKKEILAGNRQATGFDLQRTLEGDYHVMSKEARLVVEDARDTYNDISDDPSVKGHREDP